METNESANDSRVSEDLADEEIVRAVLAGEVDLFAVLIRRYDQRVYRAARAVLANDAEAEDVTQEAWVRAFEHLGQFAERARFSTWLTKIAIHEAFGRLRRVQTRRSRVYEPATGEEDGLTDPSRHDPESRALGGELRSFLETAVEALPEAYRVVFMLREVDGLSTAETANSLGLTEEAVKTRLSRARALLRRELMARAGPSIARSFPFLGRRCERMVSVVMRRIRESLPAPAAPGEDPITGARPPTEPGA
jgi:RNA polymerase sigma-70 factor (ECF subfamily)